MAPMKHKWAFSLFWINLAVAVVVLVLIVGNQIWSVSEALHVLTYALVYANLTGAMGVLVLGGIAARFALSSPLVPFVAVGVIAFSALGCLLSQTLLMEIGFVISQHFWAEYVHTLRVAMPLAAVFGLGAMVHGSLRGRVQLMEERLHEKEVTEERARRLAVEARLRLLESRIHPHFLFNTLNSISSLIAVNPPRAEQILGRLAALLRASLDSSNQPLIPLRQELAMVESYIDIERVRFGAKLRGSGEVATELQGANGAPVSGQALVENAVN